MEHLDIDNYIETTDNKIKNIDFLLSYYFDKYNIEYVYYCYLNRNNIDNTLILSRYTKNLFNKEYSKENGYLNLINFIIKNFNTSKIELKNENLNYIKDYKYNETIDFYEYLEMLLFYEDKYIESYNKIDFYRKLLKFNYNNVINNLARIKIIDFIYTKKRNLFYDLIKTDLWFNKKKIFKTILGDIFNNDSSIFNKYSDKAYNFIKKLLLDKKIKIKIRNWFIDVFYQYKDNNLLVNVDKINKKEIHLLCNINYLLLELFFNAGKKIDNLDVNFNLFNNSYLKLDYETLNYNEEFDDAEESTEDNKDKENIKKESTKEGENDIKQDYSFLEYLFYLNISYIKVYLHYTINNSRKIKIKKINLEKSLEETNNILESYDKSSNEYFINKSLKLLQEKSLTILNDKLKIYNNILINTFNNYKINKFLNFLIDKLIYVMNSNLTNKIPINYFEIINNVMSNINYISKFQNYINYNNLIIYSTKILNLNKIPHIKSKLINNIYLYSKNFIDNINWVEKKDFKNFIKTLFNQFICINKITNTWNFYEKMYIKIDILSFFINLNLKEKDIFIDIDNKKIINFTYIIIEDILELNELILKFYKNLNKETNNNKNLKLFIKKNNFNYDLIEINLEMLLNLIDRFEFLIKNKHILNNLSLSLNYTFFKNWPTNLENEYNNLKQHNIFKFRKIMYNLLIKIYTNQNIVHNNEFINKLYNNQYFSIKSFENIIIMKNLLSNLETNNYNNYYILLSNLLKEKETEIETNIEYPEEFYDPIMCSLIKKPMFLPNSDIIVDKDIIEQHLLTSETDPFTREKLTLEDLIDYNNKNEIITRINEFLDKKENFKKSLKTK